jgi:hypothetical protein
VRKRKFIIYSMMDCLNLTDFGLMKPGRFRSDIEHEPVVRYHELDILNIDKLDRSSFEVSELSHRNKNAIQCCDREETWKCNIT